MRFLGGLAVAACVASLAGACTGSEDKFPRQPPMTTIAGNADAKAFCADYRNLVNSGSQVLSDRAHWDPLIDRAAALEYEPLRRAGTAAKTELQRIDVDPAADPERLGLDRAVLSMNQPCVDLGVSPFLG